MNKSVYLAGPIAGCSYEGCTNWREEATEFLSEHGITAYSPMRHKEYLREVTRMGSAVFGGKNVFSQPAAVLARDRWDCQRSSLVLVNLAGAETVSIGTVLEVAWADSVRVPIVLVMEKEGNVHEHVLIRGMCPFQVETLEEALVVITGIL